jgi:two-component system nitrogen regulation response regulator GlnG
MTATPREFLEPVANRVEAISSPDECEDYALVVGVNDYPQLRPLRGAIADAQAFADWLIEPMGGRVPMANVRKIVSATNPLSPIVHEINEALLDVLECAGKTGGRRFYFYFSGHGCVGDRANDLALCMANWSDLRRRAALSSEAWLEIVVRSGAFAEVAFFLDCCRVWATRAVGLPPDIDFAKPVERVHPTRVFMAYATEFQRPAIEVDERSTSGELDEVRGIFTHVLLTGLRGEAVGLSGDVTAGSLKEYAEIKTEERAKTRGFHQRAEILHGFDSRARFGFFTRNQDSRPPSSDATNDTSSPSVTIVNRGDARCLTIVYHPQLDRIGERAFLGEPLDKPTALSRFEPEFVALGASHGEPLNDSTISRKPLHFTVTSDGGVMIDMSMNTTPLTISGQRITSSVALSAQDVTRGVVLTLGKRVVLLLHSIPPLDEVLDSAESSVAPELIGSSVGSRRLRLDIQNTANTDKIVLIRGETGTGKELVAQAIHRTSARRDKPMVAVNVAGITPTLAEAEFFGSDKRNFGWSARMGYLEQANGGTLFLDEIGDIPRSIQPMLLRAIELGEIQSVGLPKSRKVDVRIIAATDAAFESKIAVSGFSVALLHRLGQYEIWIPPLRERREDIGLLLARFLQEELANIGESKRLDLPDDGSTPWLPASIVAQLVDYDWPGNIRELRNVVGQLVLSNRNRERVQIPPAVERLFVQQSSNIRPQRATSLGTPLYMAAPEQTLSLRRRPTEVSENELREALRGCRWDLNATSKQLGISRASMYILKERFPWFRIAGDLSSEKIINAHKDLGGDPARMAERLEVSEHALKRRMRELGLGIAATAAIKLPAIEPTTLAIRDRMANWLEASSEEGRLPSMRALVLSPTSTSAIKLPASAPPALAIPVSTAPRCDNPDAQSRLIIEFRGRRADAHWPNACWFVGIGKDIEQIDADSIWRSADGKSAAFSARICPGSITLRYGGKQSREFGLYLYPQWTTHVIIDDAFQPHFETMRIFLLPRIMARLVESEIIRAIEQGFALLASVDGEPPPILSRVMQGDSFDNPMLGLIAAHLLARERNQNPKRILAIATRLETLLGPCPDVLALRLRTRLLQRGELPSISENNPPMLREGLVAFVEASHKEPGIVPSQSLLEYACMERLVDSPFSSWPMRRDEPFAVDWLTTELEELGAQEGAVLISTKVAREFGVPTLAVATRIEAIRHRR